MHAFMQNCIGLRDAAIVYASQSVVRKKGMMEAEDQKSWHEMSQEFRGTSVWLLSSVFFGARAR